MASLRRLIESLNGDLYGTGTRLFASIGHRFDAPWQASAQAAAAVSPAPVRGARLQLDVALAWDLGRAWTRLPGGGTDR